MLLRMYLLVILLSFHVTLIGIMLFRYLGAFTGFIGAVSQAAIVLALWYGGKLVYENVHGTHTGLTPGVLTCKYKSYGSHMTCKYKSHDRHMI